VVVPAGYDNATGLGKIFFIDAATGGKLKEMSTGFGNPGTPAGLAHMAGYTQDFHNQLIEQIYGGDLYGNFWRFDVSDADDGNWTVQKLAYFTDPGGHPQPVTVDPEIKIDIGNGIDRWVFVGTGRLLDDSDLTTPGIADQIQTFYAIRDGTLSTPNPITTPLQRSDLVTIVDQLNGLSAEPAKGWYDDIPLDENGNPGRIVVAPQAAISVVAYAATWPQTDPCLTGQKSKLFVRGYSFGNSALLDPGDATGNTIIPSLDDPTGSVGLNVVFFPPSADGSIDVRVGVTSGSGPNPGGVAFYKIKAPAFANSHRMSWRLLGQ
jgi:type IV pilus assembly protein PilY1